MWQAIIIILLTLYIIHLWRVNDNLLNQLNLHNSSASKRKNGTLQSSLLVKPTNSPSSLPLNPTSNTASPQKKPSKSLFQNIMDKCIAPYKMKQVILLRMDLSMKVGKKVAQGAHASLGAVNMIINSGAMNSSDVDPTLGQDNEMKKELKERQFTKKDWFAWMKAWEMFGTAKIALKVNSLEEIQTFHKIALDRNLPNYLVRDAGRTQVASGSITALAIGPAPVAVLDEITGNLKLL